MKTSCHNWWLPGCIGLLLSACFLPIPSSHGATHVILTCNIRVALPEDDANGFGWDGRKALCAEVMRARNPDIVCYQEALRRQVEDLKKFFPEFVFFGFDGPEMDAHPEGYHGIAKNVIMFSRERYEMVSAGGFWLSETPHLPGSLSWSSARARHVNWVRLKERVTGRQFRVLNVHLDHRSQPAREEQIKMVLAEAASYPAEFPQIFAGDFNAPSSNAVFGFIKAEGWHDTYEDIHGDADPGFTAHQFLGEKFAEKFQGKPVPGRIDFIFRKGRVRTEVAAIIKDQKDGVFPSDHYFVSAAFMLPGDVQP
jgi:endonuclease/exonuclease/phosphatase family metal-dependent hydrolase